MTMTIDPNIDDADDPAAATIAELGHTGLWVEDLIAMRAFYSEVLGLHVTDQDLDVGIVFLSSRPEVEHHEFVLQTGREAPVGSKLVHQISWRVPSLAALRAYLVRFQAHQVRVQQVVTHGNAFGVYFFDPEGNRNEVYWQTGVEVPQPFRKTLDIEQDEAAIFEAAQQLLAEDGPAYLPVTD